MKGIENITKSIQSDINDLMYYILFIFIIIVNQ